MAMVDFSLTVGINRELSYSEMQKGINDIVKQLNSNPPKIKVAFDINASVTQSLQRRVSEIIKNLSASGGTISLGAPDINTSAAAQAVTVTKELIASNKTLEAGTVQYYTALRQVDNALEAVNKRLRECSALENDESGASKKYTKLSEQAKALNELQSSIESGGIGLNDYRTKFSEIKLEVDSASNAIKEFERNSLSTDTFTSGMKGYDTALKKTEVLLKKVANAEETWTAAKHGSTYNDYKKIVSYREQLQKLLEDLQDGKLTSLEFGKSFAELDRNANIALTNIRISGKNTLSTMDRLRSLSQKFGTWFSITSVIMAAVRATKQMIKSSIELQDAFTQLKIVTGATDSQMERFADTTISLAKKLGKSVTDIAKSVETFSRLGYNLSDASKLAEYATVLSNVASVDTNEATTGMTSIIKGFNMDVSNTEHVADVLIEVGQKYAVSASELMDAYEHAGAALSATNTSFEKSAGLIAAANASVQNSSTVGTALKTLSARIRGSKSDLEELGEDIDDLANGFSKYADEIKQLTGFNIMVEGTTDQFKDLYDIFDGISKTWDGLSDTAQARIAEILGGTRQYQVIASIIGNWSDAANAYSDAMNAAGIATEANNTYMETATAQLGVLKASAQELSAEVFNSKLITGVIKIGNDAINVLTRMINNFGVLGTAIPITAITAFIKNLDWLNQSSPHHPEDVPVYYGKGIIIMAIDFNSIRIKVLK